MQDDWPPVCILNVSPRVTHNDETPVPVTMNGDQKEVFAEDIHALHDKNTLSKVGQNFIDRSEAQSEQCQGNNSRKDAKLFTLVLLLTLRCPLCACVKGLFALCTGRPIHAHIVVMCNHLSVVITHNAKSIY